MKIDPRSDRIALHYTGNDAGEPAISGVPARDLTENDIARLVTVSHGDLRGAARAGAIDKLADQLTGGPYRRTAPVKAPAKSTTAKRTAAKPVETPAPTPAPATPAEPSATTPKEA